MKASDAEKRADSKGSWPINAGANAQIPAPCAATNTEKRQLLITGLAINNFANCFYLRFSYGR